ncbi:MAG: arsenate reductase [Epsilonproteobacteria bacterium (ex Lamellibrachia satsuma)]|nr:MAG: arsenate reductase [Epsilonproteobacteria bacterium (ex Lamellibrachia satsuma)]
MLRIYGIKNCGSVRKAFKYLKSHEMPYEFVDFRETPVGKTEIDKWLDFTDIQTLFNTRGTTYRTLKLKDLHLNDEEKKRWLTKENRLIKRPVIVFDNGVIVGYNESEYLNKLQNQSKKD